MINEVEKILLFSSFDFSFTFQRLSSDRKVYALGKSWLIFGPGTGFKIISVDERRDTSPVMKFISETVKINEKDYQ